jgi:hypothetical protein
MIGYHVLGQLALIVRKVEYGVFAVWSYLNRVPGALHVKAINMGIASQEAKIDRADALADAAFKVAEEANYRAQVTYSEARDRIEKLRAEPLV